MSYKPKLIVVDDDARNRRLLELTFDHAGFEVIVLEHAMGTGAAILREMPDAVVVDYNMPGITGEEIISTVRSRVDLNGTAMLLYSAIEGSSLARAAERCNADAFIEKGGHLTDLVGAVNEAILAKREDMPKARPLFVDDEELILRGYRREFRNYRSASFVASPQAALDHIRSDSPPQMVLCDYLMPGITGRMLYELAVEHDPSMRDSFAFVTGQKYALPEVTEFAEAEGIPVFGKPNCSDDIRGFIEERATKHIE